MKKLVNKNQAEHSGGPYQLRFQDNFPFTNEARGMYWSTQSQVARKQLASMRAEFGLAANTDRFARELRQPWKRISDVRTRPAIDLEA